MKTKRFVNLAIVACLSAFLASTTANSQRYHYGRGYFHSYHYGYFHPYFSMHFGYPYGYGYYYRPYGAYFGFGFPRFGVRIATLPFGYQSFYLGPDPYYYYNGIFYRPYANEYEVVEPPMGAVVDRLPRGARVRIINGQKYYEMNGTYYEEQMDEHNNLRYRVVGTKGVLSTSPGTNDNESEPQIGDRINRLPADSKAVVINGEKLYSAPGGFYYKKVINGDKVYYELVGK